MVDEANGKYNTNQQQNLSPESNVNSTEFATGLIAGGAIGSTMSENPMLASIADKLIVGRSSEASQTFTTGSRECVTCDYWGGQRKLGSSLYDVEAMISAEGICGNRDGSYRTARRASDSCSNWKKWNVLES